MASRFTGRLPPFPSDACPTLVLFGQVMSSHYSDQMSERAQVSRMIITIFIIKIKSMMLTPAILRYYLPLPNMILWTSNWSQAKTFFDMTFWRTFIHNTFFNLKLKLNNLNNLNNLTTFQPCNLTILQQKDKKTKD